MNLNKFLTLLSLLLFISCNSQEKETYWKAENVYKVNGEQFYGLTFAFMETIAEQELHLMKKGEFITFHYPHKKKVKISELKHISNFDLLPDSNKKFDSVYNVSVEKEKLRIKFIYSGTLSDDKKFAIDFKKISKEKYFESINKIQQQLKVANESIEPFRFENLDLKVKKPEFFNKKTLNVITKNNHQINVYQPRIVLSDFGGKNPYKVNGLAIKYNENSCIATYKKNCFDGIEYLWNTQNKETEAIILLKNEKQTKSEIIKLFKTIDDNMNNTDFMIWNPNDNLELNWISETEIINLVIEDIGFLSESDFGKIDIYGTNEYYKKLFKHYSKSISKSNIKIYIISKELDNTLRSRSGGQSGEIIEYHPYIKNYH